jgi:hypothetical protein
VSERKIMDWVIKLDFMLHEKFEGVGGVHTRCDLHEEGQVQVKGEYEDDIEDEILVD